jgi:hypothetical protein
LPAYPLAFGFTKLLNCWLFEMFPSCFSSLDHSKLECSESNSHIADFIAQSEKFSADIVIFPFFQISSFSNFCFVFDVHAVL